jgi:signal transduction histidine kinase
MSAPALNLLLLEDNAGDARLVQTLLAEHAPGEFAVVWVERLATALARLDAERFDVVLCDLGLPDSRELATAQALARRAPELPLVVLTGSHERDLGREAIQHGAQDYLVKDEASGPLIARALRYAVERKRLELGLLAANEDLERRVAERTAELEQANRSLRASETRFRKLTAMSSDFYWETDAQHRLTQRGSEGGPSTTMAFQGQLQFGLRRWEIPYISPGEEAWQAHRETLDAHLPFRDFEVARMGVDGSPRHILVSGDPVFDAYGAFLGYSGVGEDITERKNHQKELERINAALEQRVRERTRALEAANKELEAFSYSVSHDLRAPLRAINGFSQLLQQQLGTGKEEECQSFLARIRGASEKMGRLIEDLLQLSRLSRQPLQHSRVDLSVLARELAEELKAGDPGRRVEWVIAPEVRVEGDASLLGVVLQNLVGNAWKYSSKRKAATIEFGTAARQGRTVYFVRDNGAGFDMAYAGKLFAAFQRLHPESEFPGTGIGLATVARLVHRHGGETWAESKVGEGATFYFTLPDGVASDAAGPVAGPALPPGSSSRQSGR